MIETNSLNLSEFLKTTGNTTNIISNAAPVAAIVAPTASPAVAAVTNTTDNIDKIAKLVDSVAKLMSSPLVSGMMSKGVERKAADYVTNNNLSPAQIAAPKTDNNIIQSNNIGDNPPLPPPVKKENKTEKAKVLYECLFKAVENINKTESEKTISDIYAEFEKEETKIELIKQIEVLL